MARKHSPQPARVTPPEPQPAASVLEGGPLVPGSEDSPAYRWAFNAYVLLFLLLVCIGLLNYLGWYLKARTN
jgi:hypothetical protein